MALKRPRVTETVSDGLARYPASMTAATALVDLGDGSSWKTWKFGNRDWQTEAWRLYDIIGEQHFLAGRIGDSVSQARLFVTEVDETGEETGEVQDETIRRLAAVPLGTGSQRDDCLRLAGIDLAVGGECWIVGEGTARNPEKAEGSWFVVTGAAFSREGGDVKVRRPQQRGGSKLTLEDGKDTLIRCWRPHPNDTDQADSFTRSAIVPLREIELLTKREFAELDSRLTGAGVMFLPEGIDFPREESDPAGIAGFMAYIQRAAAASMQDQSTANAMVPIMATVPDQMIEHLDKLKPVNFWSELSAEIGPMKEKAIARVASFAEIPAEVLTGIADSNHWTAWLISDEGIRWIKGYLGIVADALTRGFLRPALTSLGIADPERYSFAFDTSTLAAKPNRLEDALQLHDRFLLSDEETIKAGAFTVEQMPSVQERAAQLLLKVVQTQPDLMLDPAVQAALGLPQIVQVGLPATADQNTDGDPDNDAREIEGPPDDDEPPADEARAITAALDHRIGELTATRVTAPPTPDMVFNASAKLLVYRALELAGGRLATPQERRGRWAGVPRHELHARVGPITPDKALRVTEGAWNHVGVVATDLGVDSGDLERLLSGYVGELLTRGMPHHDDLLFAALSIANRGRGLLVSHPPDESSFHLPGRHNQKSHGNRLGRPGNVVTKTGIGSAGSFTGMFAEKLQSDGSAEARAHIKDLEKLPDNLKRRGAGFLRAVVVSNKSLPDSLPSLAVMKGVRPRGWPEGSTWDDVPGGYVAGERTVVAGAVEGHRGHGGISLAAHEFGHGIENSLTGDERERFNDIVSRLHGAAVMAPYFSAATNPGWFKEILAESIAAVSIGKKDPVGAVTDALGFHPSRRDTVQPIVAELVELIGDIGEPG